MAKWIGYIDRFILYPLLLRRQAQRADVIHICDQANAVYIRCLGGRPHVLTCHDVMAIRAAAGEVPGVSVGRSGKIYQRWILRNLSKAQMVVCVSEQTLGELLHVTGMSSDRVTVVGNALNYPYRPMTAEEIRPLLMSLGIEHRQPFFLHVGGNEWYKNRMGVLRIFAELIKYPAFRSHKLVMAGKRRTTELLQLGVDLLVHDRVIELVGVSDEQLCSLYSASTGLLFPSLKEGFGWPIVEAQACGCPVITTERAPMKEIGGRAAICIEPENEQAAARRIVWALAQPERWRAAGFENVKRFSTETMMDGYLSCYRRVASQNSGAGSAADVAKD